MKDEIPFVDKAKCVGAGVCAAVAPNTFKMSGGKGGSGKPARRFRGSDSSGNRRLSRASHLLEEENLIFFGIGGLEFLVFEEVIGVNEAQEKPAQVRGVRNPACRIERSQKLYRNPQYRRVTHGHGHEHHENHEIGR